MCIKKVLLSKPVNTPTAQEGYAVAPLKNLVIPGLLTTLAKKLLLSFLLLYVGTAFTLLGDRSSRGT